MTVAYKIVEIMLSDLLNYIQDKKEEGYRLVQICCTKIEEGFELNYSLSKEYDFLNYRVKINENDVVPSISFIFKYSFLYENEMKDLFGIKIKHISIDYSGSFYKLAVKTPFGSNEASEGEIL